MLELLLPLIALFRNDRLAPDLTDKDKLDDRGGGIRCPACKWRPARTDAWACNPGCGHVWNTFETKGDCPSCGKRWTQTQCTKCGTWSKHDDWYEPAPSRD
jgi:hypothetical protein